MAIDPIPEGHHTVTPGGLAAFAAFAMSSDIQYGIGAGFFRCLTKPIKLNEFMDRLDIAPEYSLSSAGRTTGKKQA